MNTLAMGKVGGTMKTVAIAAILALAIIMPAVNKMATTKLVMLGCQLPQNAEVCKHVAGEKPR
jgi:hypothetical protein